MHAPCRFHRTFFIQSEKWLDYFATIKSRFWRTILKKALEKKNVNKNFARLLPFFIRIKWICWSWRFSQKLNAASLNTTGLYIYVFFRFQVEFYYHAFPSLNIFKGLKLLPDHANSFLMVKRLSLTVVYYYFADILSRCKIRTLRSLTTLSKHVQSL